MPTSLEQAAARVAGLLAENERKLVLAESCTAGLVSAIIAQTPGISVWLCGSAVVYQEESKIAWLGVSRQTLNESTAVSREVAQEMAAGVLNITPQANVAAAITGHLGPQAPVEQDGEVHAAIVFREGGSKTICWHLPAQVPLPEGVTLRVWRQREATRLLMEFLARHLSELNSGSSAK